MDWADLIVGILTLVVLAVSAGVIIAQLRQQTRQLKTDQLIAWKTSLHSLNRLAMEHPATFKKVLYPKAKDADHVQELTAAYASLHALEAIYYMRENEKYPPPRLDAFLAEYVAGDEIKKAWAVSAAHDAFTDEFQKRLTEVIKEQEATAKQ